ncbi:MAG: hypothetical protein IPH48_10565 [bacterium]|nr:hypothetical protein [bacterium]
MSRSGILTCCLLAGLLTAAAAAEPGAEFWSSDFYSVGLAGPVRAFAEYDGMLVIGGDLTAAGGVLVDALAAWDGHTWQAFAGGVGGSVAAMLVHDGDLFVAGAFGSAGGVSAHNIARWDGGQWHPLGAGGDGIEALVVHDGRLVALGDFSATVGAAGAKLAAWDGAAWTALGDGPSMGSVGSLHAAVVHGGSLVVGGSWDTTGAFQLIAAWDGAAWSTPYANPGEYMGPFEDWEIRSLAVYQGALVAGGHFRHDDEATGDYFSGVARWDGAAWVGLGHGLSAPTPFENDVHSIRCLFEFAGDLIAGGAICQNEIPLDYTGIARWDGAQWHDMDLGVGSGWDRYSSGQVAAAIVWRERLIVGGDFRVAGVDRDVECNNIARWLDDTWQPMGPWGWGQQYPMHGVAQYGGDVIVGGARLTPQGPEPLGDMPAYAPLALIAHDGLLVAGGMFTSVGDVPALHVAAWDGASWSAIGSGVSAVVEALGTYRGELFAGPFRWTGSAWVNELQTNGPVYALCEWGGDLYAAGDFTTARGVAAAGIVRWDGTSCHALGSGLTHLNGNQMDGYALAVYGGDLVVGGNFYRAGDVAVWHIASWDGTAFHDFAPGLRGANSWYGVFSLAVAGSQLFAGGRITHVDLDLVGIGRFDGQQWHTLGSGIAGDPSDLNAFDLLVADRTLWVAGAFHTAGGRPSSHVAAWSDPAVLGSPSGVTGPPAAVVSLTASPNPFNPRTTIAFTLPQAGDTMLAVYDLAGRRVATLVEAPLPEGPTSLDWDGRDDAGRALPSGVYLVRLRQAQTIQRCQVTLVR